eukprot:TRINITY_DN15481_c0_g2_i2.p1 TRINITY_DN15481_c0_g2~~TRINITY_DN15481_c0_g2_i2.p1  ORF type:complete len:334 (-),score=72.46 TRINITY_DN15481_c0_g2_i2:34-1035(-)
MLGVAYAPKATKYSRHHLQSSVARKRRQKPWTWCTGGRFEVNGGGKPLTLRVCSWNLGASGAGAFPLSDSFTCAHPPPDKCDSDVIRSKKTAAGSAFVHEWLGVGSKGAAESIVAIGVQGSSADSFAVLQQQAEAALGDAYELVVESCPPVFTDEDSLAILVYAQKCILPSADAASVVDTGARKGAGMRSIGVLTVDLPAREQNLRRQGRSGFDGAAAHYLTEALASVQEAESLELAVVFGDLSNDWKSSKDQPEEEVEPNAQAVEYASDIRFHGFSEAYCATDGCGRDRIIYKVGQGAVAEAVSYGRCSDGLYEENGETVKRVPIYQTLTLR